ncbi:F-actin-capping protein subunit alpha [Phlyctochytrium planicorne]|nr:F-actin-capping protein subunit alpha [Phlyctochytrium planicorne]
MSAEQTLSAVIKRLETATIRLEEIVRSKGGADAPASGARELGATDAKVAPAVTAFDELISGPLQTLVDLGTSIGGLVAEQIGHVKDAFVAQRAMIDLAANSKKPDVTTLQSLLAPTQKEIEAIVSIRDRNRPSPLFNHLSAISEGIPAIGWVIIEPAPVPYVNEFKDAAQFYSNRVLKDNSDKKEHVDFVKTFGVLLTELATYVKKNHTTGLTWNPRGGDPKSFTPSAAPAASAAPASSSGPSASGLLSALNKDGLTSALRKVDKSEMTHKNPELRATSVVPAVEKPAPAATRSFGSAAPKAQPKKALEGNKWSVENFSNDSNVVVDNTELRHVVYIYNCTNSTVSIKGKVNAVTLDNCKKTGLLIESVVSTVDIINCKSSQVQVTGRAPTVVIDKTDGLQLYLSKDSVDNNVEVLTAKSSEVNVLLEGAGEDGGYAEKPVPEQLKTVVEGGKLITSIVEHKG